MARQQPGPAPQRRRETGTATKAADFRFGDGFRVQGDTRCSSHSAIERRSSSRPRRPTTLILWRRVGPESWVGHGRGAAIARDPFPMASHRHLFPDRGCRFPRWHGVDEAYVPRSAFPHPPDVKTLEVEPLVDAHHAGPRWNVRCGRSTVPLRPCRRTGPSPHLARRTSIGRTHRAESSDHHGRARQSMLRVAMVGRRLARHSSSESWTSNGRQVGSRMWPKRTVESPGVIRPAGRSKYSRLRTRRGRPAVDRCQSRRRKQRHAGGARPGRPRRAGRKTVPRPPRPIAARR